MVWKLSDINRTISRKKLIAFALAGLFPGPGYADPSFNFFKNSYEYYGLGDVLLWSSLSSDWGSVTVTYEGTSLPQYLNLSINGSWKIANMSLGAYQGIGSETSVTFNFGIDGPVGTSIDYGFSITDTPMGAPVDAFDAILQPRDMIGSQNQGGVAWLLGIAPGLLIGGPLMDGGLHQRFPNQDCDTMHCSPASVSNSLQWLNSKYGLKMPADKITIDALAKVFGTTKNGTPLPWWDKKEKYLKDEKLPVYQVVTTSIEEALKAIKAGKDLELNTQPHAAAVVDIKKLDDGRYEIAVAHDTKQGPSGAGQSGAGGTVIEKGIYDPKTGKISGITWMDGQTLTNFVVEAPIPEPATWLMLVTGFGLLGSRLRISRGRQGLSFS
jgi:hypothetical protein